MSGKRGAGTVMSDPQRDALLGLLARGGGRVNAASGHALMRKGFVTCEVMCDGCAHPGSRGHALTVIHKALGLSDPPSEGNL